MEMLIEKTKETYKERDHGALPGYKQGYCGKNFDGIGQEGLYCKGWRRSIYWLCPYLMQHLHHSLRK